MRLNFPEIPNFGSYESISSGVTLAQDQEAQTLLKGMGKSSEQLLWKRWSRRSSWERHPPAHRTNRALNAAHSNSHDVFSSSQNPRRTPEQTAATSPLNRFRFPSVFHPSSPSDIGRSGSEIRSWMEKSPLGPGENDYHFSLSSEEGTYNLPALDSDEEEAYSYILDLNRDAFQPYHPDNRQVPRVEEETTEEMILDSYMMGESEHLEGSKGFSRDVREHGGGSGSKSGIHNGDFGRKSEVRGQWRCGSGGEGRRKEEVEDGKENEVRGQSEDGEEERRKDDSLAEAEEQLLELDNGEEEHQRNFKKDSKVNAANMEEEVRQSEDEEEEEEKEEEEKEEKKEETHPTERPWPPACSAPPHPHSFEDDVILPSPVASGDASPFELTVLLALWILLYCYMIFPQMSQ